MERYALDVLDDPAGLIGLMAAFALAAVWIPAELLRARRERRASCVLALYGGVMLAATWLLLVPLTALNGALPVSVDGDGANLIELLSGLQWLACAGACGLIARRRRGWPRLAYAAGAVGALLILAGPGRALPRELLDPVGRLGGWALISGALALRYLRAPARSPLGADLSAWINRSRLGLPLALSAGLLLQQPALQTLSQAALSAAAVHALVFILLSSRPRPAPAWDEILPFAKAPRPAR